MGRLTLPVLSNGDDRVTPFTHCFFQRVPLPMEGNYFTF